MHLFAVLLYFCTTNLLIEKDEKQEKQNKLFILHDADDTPLQRVFGAGFGGTKQMVTSVNLL